MKKNYLFIRGLSLFLILICIAFKAQNVGDFKSRATGLWDSPGSWYIYNGIDWVPSTAIPGVGTNNSYKVNITSGHVITINNSVTYSFGELLINENSELRLFKDDMTVIFNTPLIHLDSGTLRYAAKKITVKLPAGVILLISNISSEQGITSADGPSCSNNSELWIGDIKYSTCTGGGNAYAGTFEQVNSAGGSINASPKADLYTICKGMSVNFTGGPGGMNIYRWTVPAGVTGTYNVTSQNLGTITFDQEGTYLFSLYIKSPVKNGIALEDTKQITIKVGETNTWNGTAWSVGNKMPSYQKAVIDGNLQVTPEGSFNACNCTVNSGKTLTIQAGAFVQLQDELNNNGEMILETDAHLLQINPKAINKGVIEVQRTVTDINNDNSHMDYLYWSSPVVGQGLQAFSTGTPANRIYQYNEPNDLFKAVSLASEPNFIPGKGYAFRAENGLPNPYSKTYLFKGVPNNGEITIGVQRSPNTGPTDQVEHGYNLIGNPYPSSLDFPVFYEKNKQVIFHTAWFWTNNFFTPNQQGSNYNQNNYAVWNGTGGVGASTNITGPNNTDIPNGKVAVGQAFIVQVRNIGMGQKIIFDNKFEGQDLRVASQAPFFSRQANPVNRFWLRLVSPNRVANTQLIGYISGATNEFEQDYDAELMSMSSDAFYSILEDKKLQINGKSQFNTNDNIPLGANIFHNGEYTIALENVEGIFQDSQYVFLKDHHLNTLTNLNETSYRFSAEKGITEGRFEIQYLPQLVLSSRIEKLNSLQIYRNGDVFFISVKNGKISEVELYDAAGKLVKRLIENSESIKVDVSEILEGIYFLRIKKDGEILSRKILK